MRWFRPGAQRASGSRPDLGDSLEMTVRPALPADAGALASVAAATFALACPPSTTEAAMAQFIATALSPEAFTRYLEDPDRALFLAEEDGPEEDEPVGYAMLVFRESEVAIARQLRLRPTVELSKIYVLAGGHGRGAAAQLLDASIAEARRRGAVGMWLGTNQANVRAQRFYLKHGFERVGTKTFRLGDVDEHDYVYERAL